MANYKKTETIDLSKREEISPTVSFVQDSPSPKIGTFISIKGQRHNLEKIRTYGSSDETTVTLVWDSGMPSQVKFSSAKEAEDLVALLDKFCL